MQKSFIYIGRKSFMAYVMSALGTAFGVFLFVGPAIWAAFGELPLLALALAAISLFIAAAGVYNLFYLRTVRWIISEEELRIEAGILPWAKSSFGHPYETIFEAYYHFGFFAKIFGYGTCSIRRTEGSTTGASESRMLDAAKITTLINQRVKTYREAMRPGAVVAAPVTSAPARTQVQELAELARLKAAGAVTTEEFEVLKRGIVEVHAAAIEGGAR